MPLYKDKDSVYKVRTLLDSGDGPNWIAGKLLKYVNYTRMPAQRLTIATLNGSVKRKCELVQVYFRTHTLVPIECFVLDVTGEQIGVALNHVESLLNSQSSVHPAINLIIYIPKIDQ